MNKQNIITGLINMLMHSSAPRHERVRAANIIYEWYGREGAFDDFDNEDEFLSYVQSDISNILDAADDSPEKSMVMQVLL